VSIMSIKGTAIVRTDFVEVSSSTRIQGESEPNTLNLLRGLATSTAITWNVSLALIRLNAKDGPAAYKSLALEVQNAVTTGSFLRGLKTQSKAFSNVTTSSTVVSTPSFMLYIAPTALPTAAPTIVAVIPEVSLIRSTDSTPTSLTVSISLVKVRIVATDVTGGYLYCIAMNNGTAPTSVGNMKAAINDASSLVGAMSVLPIAAIFPLVSKLTFKGLTALKTYAIYCYVETAIGTGNSLSAVLATRLVQTTACCKSISFVNSPTFVYGDVSKYLISSVASTYTFVYALSAAPSNDLRVKVIVMRNGVISKDLVITPALTSFGVVKGAKLSGQFILSAINSSIQGSYVLFLDISGSSTSQYYSNGVQTVVQILSSKSPVPAPVLVSSTFSDSGQAVVITFNTATDRGGILDVVWPCSLLFQFNAASNTTCSWVNSSAVVTAFGSLTSMIYLLPGDPVALIGNKLKAVCLMAATSESCALNMIALTQSIITSPPYNPRDPTIIVSTPSLIASCQNLTIDATSSYGNGGRKWEAILWKVSAIVYGAIDIAIDTSIIQSFLNAYSALFEVSQPISVPASMLTKATYTIALSMTNFLGYESFQTVVVLVSGDPNVPILSIVGLPYQAIVASSSVTIQSTAFLSSCASRAKVIKYVWSVKQENLPASILSTSLDATRFFLPAYRLDMYSFIHILNLEVYKHEYIHI
jgi:hypothetical protein